MIIHMEIRSTPHLEPRHGVESHPDGGDDDEHHRDEGDKVGSAGGLRVLHQVPHTLLVPGHQTQVVICNWIYN